MFFFALLPGRFGGSEGIAAFIYDLGDCAAKSLTDQSQRLFTALVFYGVVQQGGDGFVFIPTILQYESRYAHQMGDVWDFTRLAYVALVELVGEGEGFFEASAEG
jgi:hypothetical protein